MLKFIFSFFLTLLTLQIFGQSIAESDSTQIDFVGKLHRLRSSMDSLLNPKTLDGILSKEFSENSRSDGRWVYYPEKANIQKIDKPEVRKIIPDYSFYKVRMTNYLGYHINASTCLILFDSVKSKVILAVPMWYSDLSEDFLKLFIGKKINDSTQLLNFTYELQDLMNVPKIGDMENTKYTNGKVTFDITYQGANRKEVWRNIKILTVDNTIKEFSSINPGMNTIVTIK